MPKQTASPHPPAAARSACRKKPTDASIPTSIVLPRPLQEAVIRQALREDRSFSSVVRLALGEYLAALR
jgi:hypothetical protein